MGKLLRGFGWLLLTFLLVWALVIGYWRLAGVAPDLRDLVLYLGVLPLGVFAVLALLRRGLDSARRKKSAVDTEAGDDGSADAASASPPREPALPLGILAAALRLPAGSDAAALVRSLAEPVAPDLHDRLKDGSGFPVFASWAEDVDVDMAEQALDAARARSPRAPERLDPEQLRAIGLLLPVAQDLLQQIVAGDWLTPPAAPAANAGRPAPPPVLVQARLFLPADWPAAVGALVMACLEDEAQACDIPAAQWSLALVPAASADEIWRDLATIAAQPAASAASAPIHLLLACHSQLGERSVQRLDQGGRLFSSQRPEGLVPGEGAAGLLLLAGDADEQFAATPRAVLRAHASASQGVSWQARAAIAQTGELLERLLQRVPDTARADVEALVRNADLRRSRATAVAGFAGQVLDHLDTDTNCLSTGSACGHVGIVSPLALLALAAEKAAADAARVLALAVAEPDQRALALVLPFPPPAAAASTSDLPST
ncbi:MAG TPA: hypothetical protein PLF73_01490 [Luteimonas sp.]|nr:hypothetical protein [Luteimonas sp.]